MTNIWPSRTPFRKKPAICHLLFVICHCGCGQAVVSANYNSSKALPDAKLKTVHWFAEYLSVAQTCEMLNFRAN